MKFEEALQKAQEVTKQDYIEEGKRGFVGSMASTVSEYDPTYDNARIWKKNVFEKYILYSLSGTPPKAFLVIFNGTKKILCRRTINGKTFKTFDFEDEPSGSPSVFLGDEK